MAQINWKVRIRNKVWLTGFVSQTLLLIQAIIVGLAGFDVIALDITRLDDWVLWITGIVNLLLAYFSYLGIVVEPSKQGVNDPVHVLTQETPKE